MIPSPGGKVFLSAQELLDLSFELGHKIAESGFRPSCLIGVWRGGAPVGIAVHEYLSLRGIHPVHFPVKTQRYGPDGDTLPQTRIWGLSAWDDEIDKAESLLIVDDVWDKGVTICELVEKLKKGHEDLEVRTAVLLYKPGQSVRKEKPDFYLLETDDWVVFPHELSGLDPDEILRHKRLDPALFSFWFKENRNEHP